MFSIRFLCYLIHFFSYCIQSCSWQHLYLDQTCTWEQNSLKHTMKLAARRSGRLPTTWDSLGLAHFPSRDYPHHHAYSLFLVPSAKLLHCIHQNSSGISVFINQVLVSSQKRKRRRHNLNSSLGKKCLPAQRKLDDIFLVTTVCSNTGCLADAICLTQSSTNVESLQEMLSHLSSSDVPTGEYLCTMLLILHRSVPEIPKTHLHSPRT